MLEAPSTVRKEPLVAESTLDRRRERLSRHLESYWKRHEDRIVDGEIVRAEDVMRWKELFGELLRDDRFLALAEPVDANTPLRPSEYFMRFDGVHVFPELVMGDEDGNLIFDGNPMRFPHDPDAPVTHRYRSERTEEIFGVSVRTITTVLNDEGQRDHACQMEEMEHIRLNQLGSRRPIAPFTPSAPLSEALRFDPQDMLVHFPVKGALRYMYEEKGFEPTVKSVDWLLGPAKELPACPRAGFSWENLGATGSASFGDEEDLEDFDVVFLGPVEHLVEVRDFLFDGTRRGTFRPVTCPYKRRLRVCNRSLTVDLTGEELIFCSFLGIDPPEADPLHGMAIRPLHEVEYFECRVVDDRYNMVSPSRMTVRDFTRLRGELPDDEELELIMMHGAFRGQFAEGNWLRVSNALLVEIRPRGQAPRRALLARGWYDIDLASW